MENHLSYVLEQYNLQSKPATLTGHNETMTFNVADLFLIRIHKSADIFSSDFLYNNLSRKEILNSEIQFLRYLKKCGLNVQSPVWNKNGEYISFIEDCVPVTVLEWIKGRNACKQDLTEEFCFEFGKTVATLHNASSGFCTDHILKYNNKLCDILLSQLYDAHKKGYFKSEHYIILTNICNAIKTVFENEDNTVIIHGDLSLSNTIITSDGLSLIDFSLMGLGNPMIDVACAYSFINDKKLQLSFNYGYESCGNTINSGTINICYAFNELLGIILHISKLVSEKWFDSWLDKLCKNIFIPVIENRDILWTELNV